MLDVAIIGGGICGCSLLYQLSRYKVQAALLEKENDVSVGTTKANSAIVHAGYDPEPGTFMAKYNVEGNKMVEELCARLSILYKKIGSLVLAFDEEDRRTLEKLYHNGLANGVPNLRIVEQQELREMEPNIASEAFCALHAPTGGVVNPWELALAQAEVAVQNGAKVMLNTQVTSIAPQNGHFVLQTSSGPVEARFVVNAAGVHAAEISRMAGDESFNIFPNKGQYYLPDTTQGGLVKQVIFQCPTKVGKGILVSPTVHGNLIVGPDSASSEEDDLSTDREGLEIVKQLALKSVPGINFRESIRNFAGLRATSTNPDFIVEQSAAVPGFFQIAGIKSPGLTAAPAIAKGMLALLQGAGLSAEKKETFDDTRKITRIKYLTSGQKMEAIRQNPLYGNIVCRCETVTEGEIVDCLHSPLPPHSVDGVKRRTSAGMGRCQGGFCGPRVQALIARELGLPQQQVPLDRQGMNIIVGETKAPEKQEGRQ
ncbi:MAG: NAD(P)/FAD-dependent oxidoreductase [Oscillospiraceae bacterium]